MLKLLVVLIAAALVPVFATTPAQAATCSWTYGGQGYSEQYCYGIRHEYLGSKVYETTATYIPGTAQYGRGLYVSGLVRDKAADSNCAWVRYTIDTAYPTVTYNTPKVCGAGNEHPFNVSLISSQLPGNATVRLYLCQEGGLGCAAVFYERSWS